MQNDGESDNWLNNEAQDLDDYVLIESLSF